ncbi:CHASE2 domain-containing protein [Pannonibacter indicus]|uniref:CHASE2 domain-containing protein n=1 Tax=Pannonibacter indicus TaxID=466044 RepID=UPI0035B2DB49
MTMGRASKPALAGPLQRRLAPVLAACLALILVLPVATRLEPRLGDVILFAGGGTAAERREDIVILTITEETLAAFPYRSPIDRGFLAALIRRISATGPKAIGIDILFDGPSDPVKDADLLAAIDEASSPVILAVASDLNDLTPQQRLYLGNSVSGRGHGSIVLQRDDSDGIVRHLPFPQDRDGAPITTFTAALAGASAKAPTPSGRILYQAPQGPGLTAFPQYPAHTAALLPDEWLAGKYLLIGTDLPHLDQHPAPMVSLAGTEGGTVPGIAIHAHILAQVLEGRSLPALPLEFGLMLAALAAVATVTGFTLTQKPGRFFLVLGLTAFACLAVSALLLRLQILQLPVLTPPAAAIAAALLLALFRWRIDRSERAFLNTAFSRYVSPQVVQRLTSGRLSLALGGEKRTVTYVFTDLEGFTTLSEQLTADQVAAILNRYLDRMCDLFVSHGATIDKLIGDAVVGFFGAPEEDPEQSLKAVKLALAVDAFCEGFRKEMAAEGIPLGVTRIGLHRGEAVVGNFGGSRFFDYTGIGDTVNTAARLEGANKYLGTRICVSAAAAAHAPGMTYRRIGDLVVKGRAEPLPCVEPLSEAEAGAEWMAAYAAAFVLLQQEDAEAARQGFETVLRLRGDDGPSRLHLARLGQGETGTQIVLGGK